MKAVEKSWGSSPSATDLGTLWVDVRLESNLRLPDSRSPRLDGLELSCSSVAYLDYHQAKESTVNDDKYQRFGFSPVPFHLSEQEQRKADSHRIRGGRLANTLLSPVLSNRHETVDEERRSGPLLWSAGDRIDLLGGFALLSCRRVPE